jgi:hypothetical protein
MMHYPMTVEVGVDIVGSFGELRCERWPVGDGHRGPLIEECEVSDLIADVPPNGRCLFLPR